MLIPEDILVAGLLARESRAMTQFYQRYRLALLTATLRIVRNRQSAEDILQQSMVKV
jgi:DNA-directed RNA polymerase specialized sigma24 family protein